MRYNYDIENRCPYVMPEDMNEEQKKFYNLNLKHMEGLPYIWLMPDGQLNGPSAVMMHEPEIANMFFPMNRMLMGQTRVSKPIQELCVLVTVCAAKAAYGMYAHTQIAKKFGLESDKIAAISAGQRPANLTEEEQAAYDLAYSLNQSGPISGEVFDRAVMQFGKEGVSILTFLIGNFKMVGTLLNAYNEPVPEYR